MNLTPQHYTATVRSRIMQAMRQYLRLMAMHGADAMLQTIPPRIKTSEPRQRIATDREREALLRTATLALRVHILLCADLGMRAGTAIRIAEIHRNRENNELRINGIKHGTSLITPITRELAQVLDTCERLTPFANPSTPYVERARGQSMCPNSTDTMRYTRLNYLFRSACKRNGITNLRVHDFRRTLAEKLYRSTGDMRVAQSVLGHQTLNATTHYLQRIATRPDAALLERIKLA